MDEFKMDAYVDSDFLGLYGKEDRSDLDNVKSRGGHVILVNGCPLIWQSKLIDAVCLSTMMAEYYALSIAMREVLPLRDLVRTIAKSLEIDEQVQTDLGSPFGKTTWDASLSRTWILVKTLQDRNSTIARFIGSGPTSRKKVRIRSS